MAYITLFSSPPSINTFDMNIKTHKNIYIHILLTTSYILDSSFSPLDQIWLIYEFKRSQHGKLHIIITRILFEFFRSKNFEKST